MKPIDKLIKRPTIIISIPTSYIVKLGKLQVMPLEYNKLIEWLKLSLVEKKSILIKIPNVPPKRVATTVDASVCCRSKRLAHNLQRFFLIDEKHNPKRQSVGGCFHLN